MRVNHMYDIHCHVLPGVDDGPGHMDESLKMIKAAEAAGINKIIATPHYIEGLYERNTSHNLALLERLRAEAAARQLDVELLPGNEVYLVPGLLKLLDEGKISTLNHSRYLLVEFPAAGIPAYAERLIVELQLGGLTVILAHPERNFEISENPDKLHALTERGVLAQLDLLSIDGFFGRKAQKTASTLLKRGLVHFIATDFHNSRLGAARTVKMLAHLKRLIPDEKIAELTLNNPRQVILDEPVGTELPVKLKKQGPRV